MSITTKIEYRNFVLTLWSDGKWTCFAFPYCVYNNQTELEESIDRLYAANERSLHS